MRTAIIVILSLFATQLVAQKNFKKLNVFKTEEFNSKASVTVEAMTNDPLLATDALKNGLLINGFKVISERVAKERVELINKAKVDENGLDQKISIGETTYINSVYVITFNYKYRADTGCSESVMNNLSGQIIDLANDGQLVATFSFKQGSFEGKCTDEVMQALARKLKS